MLDSHTVQFQSNKYIEMLDIERHVFYTFDNKIELKGNMAKCRYRPTHKCKVEIVSFP